MSLGLFKPSINRFRIVAPGYDQNDPTVPPNKVIFDANFTETQRIITKGVTWVNVPPESSGTHILASWPYRGYIPLCYIGELLADGSIATMAKFQFVDTVLVYDGSLQIITSNSLKSSGGSCTFYWVVFNTAAP